MLTLLEGKYVKKVVDEKLVEVNLWIGLIEAPNRLVLGFTNKKTGQGKYREVPFADGSYQLVRIWRAFEILRNVPAVDQRVLEDIYACTERKAVDWHQFHYREVEGHWPQYGRWNLYWLRRRLMNSAPEIGTLEDIMRICLANGVSIDYKEIELEIKAGRLLNSEYLKSFLARCHESELLS